MKVIFLGSGNLATRLSLEMLSKGFDIIQVYSHTASHAESLAQQLGCPWTTDPKGVMTDGDLYIFALKDAVLPDLIARIRPNGGMWVHTAGSMPMDIFSGYAEQYGVIYPMQTFSKSRLVDFSIIPFFLEANTSDGACLLQSVAEKLSGNIRFLSSDKRRHLHLAAVFACNFTNHIYSLASRLLEQQDIPAEILLPLIDETAAKIHVLPPKKAQTGPAIRYDENVINKHLAMLDDPDMQSIYRIISQSIHKEAQHE